MHEDLFLKIIRKELPSHSLYEDTHTYAFLDINPVNPGHALVVPKTRYENLYDMPEEEWCAVAKTVQKIACAVKKATRADGINLEMNNEYAAGQLVLHAHVHVIPRFEGDGLLPWPGKKYTEGEAEEIAARIREAVSHKQ